MQQRPPLLSIALLSGASLAYEILLMRLFSIVQWHHFAYMIISLALLGYGISGTFTAIFRHYLIQRYRALYPACLGLFGLSTILCFLAAQYIPFNGEEILWDGVQIFYLLALFLLLTLPFWIAATAICLTFMYFNQQVARIYAFDLLGAGLGCLGIVWLLFLVFPETALVIVGASGLIAFLAAYWELHIRRRAAAVYLSALALLFIGFATPLLQLNISPYKGLRQTLLISGTRIIEQLSSPLGLLSIVQSDKVPLRHAPGLSLLARQEPPAQLAVFTDGDNMAAINGKVGAIEQLNYLDQVTSALPYHLKRIDNLLILGSGGGTDILQANYHQVQSIDAVELNPQIIELVSEKYSDFSGNPYGAPNVSVFIDDVRGFLTTDKRKYDLIQLALMDAFNASASGLYALNESYLYTIEALQLYFRHLKPNGYVSITRWIKLPPRDTLKLFGSAVEALKQSGVNQPEQHLVLIRSWQTGTLLIKNRPFTTKEIQIIENFCTERLFDIAYTPSIKPEQVNRYNILKQPIFYLAAKHLLSEKKQQFLDTYKFNLQPATDDRPYFHQFFKWSILPEVFELRGQGGLPLLEWGYIIFIATLAIATLSSIVLILLPLRFYPQASEQTSTIKIIHVICYFFSIGLAFLFIEIAFMQKFILFLHHPIYSISTSLSAFLVFAGCGSYYSSRFTNQVSNKTVFIYAVSGIALLSFIYSLALPVLFNVLAAVPLAVKISISIVLIAPLAFLMGLPFPLALSNLAQYAEQLIPWAWGINGCASVISAVLATLLAIHFGFNFVILSAAALYLAIIFVFPEPSKKPYLQNERL